MSIPGGTFLRPASELSTMSEQQYEEGDAVSVHDRPATVLQSLKGGCAKVRYEDNGTVAWPKDETINERTEEESA